ncbi:MAG: pentapeptide repeat-containing protein [Sphingomonas bacterium]|uniref:pentapeptide repeat-containing protein n=1 Tax=Sphingomonas bacterium TaxID=1895847 RepID=UPI002622C7DC|nr:pentapeptide repeat-containing protein [Sphingomonas bacterium]MDB5711533.1 pentapeptide repeat-containing protein [Sphingomonas bacterium]
MILEGSEASLLRAGADAIARWRSDNGSKRINAQAVDVSKLDLSGANLSKAKLARSKFSQCDLRHASFEGADLSGVFFENCRLDDVNFCGALTKATQIYATSIDGAQFGGSRTVGRLSRFDIVKPVERAILVDKSALPWFDRWVGWDRLRFLATIRIFVPAYASLTLTVLYLNGVAWYNSAIGYINAKVSHFGTDVDLPTLPAIVPTWTHLLVLLNFAFLAVAATCFLGCPARIAEFSREKWLSELSQPEILYDHASWRRPTSRIICATALVLGGALSTFLLARAIIQQAVFIACHIG